MEQLSFEKIPQVSKEEDVTADNAVEGPTFVVILCDKDEESDEEISIVAATKEEVLSTNDEVVDGMLDIPEDEKMCPDCCCTPCEWLNWRDVLEPYFRDLEDQNLPPNQKRFSCYRYFNCSEVWSRCTW
jgi:hypothetical protein